VKTYAGKPLGRVDVQVEDLGTKIKWQYLSGNGEKERRERKDLLWEEWWSCML
jgi:hypothetical protein